MLNREEPTHQAANAFPGQTATAPASAANSAANELHHCLTAGIYLDTTSPYGLVAEDGKPVIFKFGRKPHRDTQAAFCKRAANPFRDRKTSDGIPFDPIARINPSTELVNLSFGAERSLIDEGGKCPFCHYDNRKRRHPILQSDNLKTAVGARA